MRRWAAATCVVVIVWLLPACAGRPAPQTAREAVGWVSSGSPEATAAGVRILESGGNAVDAAVAISFALGVTEPAMSGLGGQTQMLLWTPDRGGVVINGTSFTPSATPPDASPEDVSGHRATTIPTTVRVLDYAWRRFGSDLPWSRLLQPAIDYAEQGFAIGPFRQKVVLRHLDDLRNSVSAGALFLQPDGRAPANGATWRQPRLAETLRRLAAGGADAFYRGDIARAIDADMRANDGWLRYDDLAALSEPAELRPLRGSYRGFDVWTLPPPGGGWVVLRMLNRLEQIDAGRLQLDGAGRSLRLADILRDGHRTRAQRPIENLTSYEDEVAARIRPDGDGGETTHFSVVDATGLAVSVTASINNYFGARVAHPELGFLYNDYMREFQSGTPDHPFALRPDAMPYSSMSPTILSSAGRPVLLVGSPGSGRIISAIVQVIQLWVDTEMDIQQSVAAPRLHAPGDHRLFAESNDLTDEEVAALVDAGFAFQEAAQDLASDAGNPYFGGVHALAFENGGWRGAADPRRDGASAVARAASEQPAQSAAKQ